MEGDGRATGLEPAAELGWLARRVGRQNAGRILLIGGFLVIALGAIGIHYWYF